MTILTVAVGTFLGNLSLLFALGLLNEWASKRKRRLAEIEERKFVEAMKSEIERMANYVKMEG